MRSSSEPNSLLDGEGGEVGGRHHEVPEHDEGFPCLIFGSKRTDRAHPAPIAGAKTHAHKSITSHGGSYACVEWWPHTAPPTHPPPMLHPCPLPRPSLHLLTPMCMHCAVAPARLTPRCFTTRGKACCHQGSMRKYGDAVYVHMYINIYIGGGT